MFEHFWKSAGLRWKVTAIAVFVTQMLIWLLPLDSYVVFLEWGKIKKPGASISVEPIWLSNAQISAIILLFVAMAAWNVTSIVSYLVKRFKADREDY